MAMEIFENYIEINVPNSEALIEAQHFGIKNRTVGQYYMSEKHNEVISFLNNLEGKFYLDLYVSFGNIEILLAKLKDNRLETCFKTGLTSQTAALKTIDWYMHKNDHLYRIESPTVNDQAKYLKFDITDEYLKCFLRLCLGDLSKIIIKKLSNDCFLIYIKENETFQDKLDNDIFARWENNDESCNSF